MTGRAQTSCAAWCSSFRDPWCCFLFSVPDGADRGGHDFPFAACLFLVQSVSNWGRTFPANLLSDRRESTSA